MPRSNNRCLCIIAERQYFMELRQTFPAQVESYDHLRDFIEAFCDDNSIHPQISTRAVLIIEELFANTLDHGLAGRGDTQISLELVFAAAMKELAITYTDQGAAFNPFECSSPEFDQPLEDRRIGGLGVHIIKELCRSTAYKRLDNSNVITCKLGTR